MKRANRIAITAMVKPCFVIVRDPLRSRAASWSADRAANGEQALADLPVDDDLFHFRQYLFHGLDVNAFADRIAGLVVFL